MFRRIGDGVDGIETEGIDDGGAEPPALGVQRQEAIGANEFFADQRRQSGLSGSEASSTIGISRNCDEIVAKIGLGDEAELGQYMIESFAALARRPLDPLQRKIVDRAAREQKDAEVFGEFATTGIKSASPPRGALDRKTFFAHPPAPSTRQVVGGRPDFTDFGDDCLERAYDL